MSEAGLKEVETYVTHLQNTVAHYLEAGTRRAVSEELAVILPL